jgi:RNA polymerase sigma-70 factor (ECF subfamily)
MAIPSDLAGATPATNDTGDFGDELARLRGSLYSRALFLAQDPALADDLVQEVLERALLARDRFQHGTHLRAWLCSIMRNLHIDGRRRALTRMRLDRQAEADRIPADGPLGPLDLISRSDVIAAMETLEPPQREVFKLACLEGLSYQQVAARLGVPANTVGTRLLRAKRRLRRVLEALYEQRADGVA